MLFSPQHNLSNPNEDVLCWNLRRLSIDISAFAARSGLRFDYLVSKIGVSNGSKSRSPKALIARKRRTCCATSEVK